jgi:hypothetical protein
MRVGVQGGPQRCVCVGRGGVAALRSGDRLRLPLWGIWGGVSGGGEGPCDVPGLL